MTFPDVLPHGDVEQLIEGVYTVTGSVKMGPGIQVSRIMTIVADGDDLSLINSVRLDARGEEQLRALGTVKHVVKLGFFHGMDDPYYLKHFDADYWALPKGTRKKDPKATQTLAANHLPISDAELFAFEDTKFAEGALLLKREGGLLITCDALQNWPDTEGCSLPAKLVTRVMGFTKRPAQIGGPWKKGMTPEGGSLKADFERLSELPFCQLVSGHGKALRSDAQAAVKASVAAHYGNG